MHSKGIPTFAQSAWPTVRASQWIIFVCINEQVNDARALLNNPEHIPAHPVDVDAFAHLASTSTFPTILRWSLGALLVVGLLFSIAIFLSFGQIR